MPEPTTLTSAVNDAIKDDKTVLDDKKDKLVVEAKGDKDNKDGLSDDERTQAVELFKSLKDETKAPIVIKFMAEQAGYTKAEVKADPKQAKKDIKAHLTEHLGDEFAPLIEKMAPALDAWIKDSLDDGTKEIKEQLSASLEDKTRNEVTEILSTLATKNHDATELPDNVLDEIGKLQKKFLPQKGMSTKEYINFLYDAAIGKLGISKSTKSDKTKKNREDAGSRLASEGRGGNEIGVTLPKKMSLKEAVQSAMESVSAGD